MAGIGIALVASLLWGIGDYIGGLEARRRGALSVIVVSQPVSLTLALAFAASSGDALPPTSEMAVAALAGVAGAVALGALFAGLARGTIALVSPVSALGVVIPICFGLACGEAPAQLQRIGIVVAIAGLVLALEPTRLRLVANGTGIALGALAAAGFGLLFVGIDVAAEHSVPWAVAGARLGAAVAVGAALLAKSGAHGGASGIQATPVRAAVVVGVLDVLGSISYATATALGLVAVVAVCASLYPAVTVALAAVRLHEPLADAQQVGVAVALLGVALMAAHPAPDDAESPRTPTSPVACSTLDCGQAASRNASSSRSMAKRSSAWRSIRRASPWEMPHCAKSPVRTRVRVVYTRSRTWSGVSGPAQASADSSA